MSATGHRDGGDERVGELVSRASEQLSQLVREELRLAQAEMTRKGRRCGLGGGLGGGLFGGAGLFAVLALQVLAVTAVAALALAPPVWAAALVVTGLLALVAAVPAAAGRGQFGRAAPPVPRAAVDSVKADIAELEERAHR
ncbi:phage holin family protein [Actinacidiphila glaucinigra]|uniref:phage holin family protein n=1 Tax=Actinacidiphila glaucinigra TaxID=235986 RepID=UPI002DD7FD72|nr:phage holin family protein [Actinacidiphila glaucinigra]WSD64289.1 phage holin family protein [Actinacidiphila glaucinigra]